jgi:NADPH2:quinone reductase
VQLDDDTRRYLAGPPAPYGTLADLMPVLDAAAFPVQPGAAALVVAGMADWAPLDYRGHLRPGETVLILGTGGTAGQLVVQAAVS